jgi:HAD superfamily hydrolase (TIGR01549 family)
LRETDRELTPELISEIQDAHRDAYLELADTVRPLPGSIDLLRRLTELGVPWAVATSSRRETARRTLADLGVPEHVPIVTRDLVARAKPDPDLFLAAADALGMRIEDCLVVGDSVWDLLAARRARALGVGLLSGGYGLGELERAGAYRVYEDPADMLRHLDEVGIRDVD